MIHPTPRRFHFVAASVGVVTAVIATWPVALHLRDHVLDGARLINASHPEDFWAANIGADVLTTVWIVAWVLHALVTQPLHLFEANIFYPAPLSLARCEHMFATALLGIPGALVGGPVFSHQTALLLCLLITVWSTAYVVTRWSGSTVGGLVAGVLFVMAPAYRGKLVLLKLLGMAYFPLILFGLERFAATGAPRWIALGGVALLLQMLSGQYLAYFALATWVVAGVIALLGGRPAEHPWRRLVRDGTWIAAVSAGVAILALPFILPYMRLTAAEELPDNSTNSMILLASVFSLRSYFATGSVPFSWVNPASFVPIGPAVEVLAALGAVGLLGSGRAGRIRLLMLVSVGLVAALLSLGPRPEGLGLQALLAQWVPGFRTVREPHRWAMLVQLMPAMLAGLGVAAVVRWLPRVGWLIAGVLVTSALARVWPASPVLLRAMPVGPALPPAYGYLARCGEGDPLLELPASHPSMVDNSRDAVPTFFSTFHWLPLLNGRSGYQPPLFVTTMKLAQLVPNPGAVAELRQRTSVRWVLVHCDAPRPRPWGVDLLCGPNGWPDVTTHVFGDARLFDLGPMPPPREWPRRWVARGDCS